MPKPKRVRAVLVGAADYRSSWLPRTNLTVSDPWPLPATLATYRMDLATYQRMYALQEGRCAICRVEKEPIGLVIDHNHKTKKVRGLLCSTCNTGLGFFRDIPDLLDAAIEYLDERGCYGPDSLKEEPA